MSYSIEQFRSGEIAVNIRSAEDDATFRALCNAYDVPIMDYTYECAYKEKYLRDHDKHYEAGIAYRRCLDESYSQYDGYMSDYCYIGWFSKDRCDMWGGEPIVEVELWELEECDVETLGFDTSEFIDMINM